MMMTYEMKDDPSYTGRATEILYAVHPVMI